MKTIIAIALLIFSIAGFALPEISVNRPEKGEWDFAPRRLWRLDEAAGAPFGEIQRLIIPVAGRVVIQDRKQYRLYMVDGETGEVLHAFGKRGEGPGEIRRMQGVMAAPGGVVVPERGRLHFFNLKGVFKRSVVIPVGIVPRVFIDNDRIVSAPVLPRQGSDGTETISIYSISTHKAQPVARYRAFAGGKATQSSGGNVMTVGIVIGGLTPMMEVAYHGGIIYYGKNDLYRISGVRLDGREISPIGISGRERAPVSTQFKRDLFKDMEGEIPQQMLDRILKGLPDRCTAWMRMTTDSSGRIYVLGADLEQGNAIGVDIFSKAGGYLYRGEFSVSPEDTIQDTAFKDNLLVLAIQDEEGELRVEGFRISLPGA